MVNETLFGILQDPPERVFKEHGYYSVLDFAREISAEKDDSDTAVILAWKLIHQVTSNQNNSIEVIFDYENKDRQKEVETAQRITSEILIDGRKEYDKSYPCWILNDPSAQAERSYILKIKRLSQWIEMQLDREDTDEVAAVKENLRKYKIRKA